MARAGDSTTFDVIVVGAGPGGEVVASRLEVEVGDQVLRADRIVVATGSEPSVPAIPGLAQSGYWTSREATTIADVPSSAIVLGAGPVGIELAQLLRRFGAEVHLLEAGDSLLAREEPRVSELIADALREDGIDARVGVEVESVTARDHRRVASLAGDAVEADVLIVATGRAPQVQDLGLDASGSSRESAGSRSTSGAAPARASGRWAMSRAWRRSRTWPSTRRRSRSPTSPARPRALTTPRFLASCSAIPMWRRWA
jgi:pyruvate/2-oxoglutarate dehydrogenase complex dihydrolipoamide dehydrogenase (E3) component